MANLSFNYHENPHLNSQHEEEYEEEDGDDEKEKRVGSDSLVIQNGQTNSLEMQGLIPSKAAGVVKYRECQRNHAANIGGHALDGCGEFMPRGKQGSPEFFKCHACGCHRNFHRQEIEGNNHTCFSLSGVFGFNNRSSAENPHNSTDLGPSWYLDRKSCVLTTTSPLLKQAGVASSSGPDSSPSPSHHGVVDHHSAQMLISLSDPSRPRGTGSSSSSSKKRFRTKFSTEQKEKMHAFADQIGWRMQKQDDDVVQSFCNEVGIKRQVLKVWMHNNKNTLGKKP